MIVENDRESILSSKSSLFLSLVDLAQLLKMDVSVLKKELSHYFELKNIPHFLPPDLVRDFLLTKKFKYPHKVVSVQMLKGGVAKTTSVMNLGIRAAMYGAKVLFVDLDQQANLTFALGAYSENNPVWLDIFEKKKSITECTISINKHIDLIPSSLNNSVLERSLINSHRNWSQCVLAPLEQIKLNYDLIIIDTAPALSATNTAVTIASDLVIMPVNPDKFSILGFEKNRSEFLEIKKDFNLKCDYQILFTKFDSREKLSSEYLEIFIEKYPEHLFKTFIRTSSEVKNTLGSSRSVFSNKSSVKEDYDLLTLEVLNFES